MDRSFSRTPVLAVIGLMLGVGVLAIMFSGGQVKTILSTVGASITSPNGGTSAGGTDSGGSGSGGSGDTTSGATGGSKAAAAVGGPRILIVRTGRIELEVGDLVAATRQGDAIVSAAGGYVAGSERSTTGDEAGATVSYRIPSAAWDTTLDRLRSVAATVRHEEISTDEVTGQVADLAARIANLQATEAAFQAIMTKATRIDDVLDVQRELTKTRDEIERLVAEKAGLEDRASFGNLTVSFRLPAPPAVAAVRKGWDPAADVDRATGRLIRIGQVATSVAIWLAIVGLPLLIALGIGLLVARVAWRFVARRREAGDPVPG